MRMRHIISLDHLATELSFEDPNLCKKSIITLFLCRFLEGDTKIFKNPDSEDHYDAELMHLMIDVPSCRKIKLEDLEKFQARLHKPWLTSKTMHHDGLEIRYNFSGFFPLIRSSLLSRIFHYMHPPKLEANHDLGYLDFYEKVQTYQNFHRDNPKAISECASHLSKAMMNYLFQTPSFTPTFLEIARHIILHDSVAMRFVAYENLKYPNEIYEAFKQEEREKSVKTGIVLTISEALNTLINTGEISLSEKELNARIGNKIKRFLNIPMSETTYQKHAKTEYLSLLKKKR